MKKALFIVLAVITGIIPIIYYGWMIGKTITFSKNCSQHFELAANANSVEIAELQLTKGIDYLESHNLTKGDCKLFIANNPKNNITIWYTNLKIAQQQLQDMIRDSNYTNLEESNVLMKLRETLYDGERLVTPSGISFYPNRTLIETIAFSIWASWILTVIFVCLAMDE